MQRASANEAWAPDRRRTVGRPWRRCGQGDPGQCPQRGVVGGSDPGEPAPRLLLAARRDDEDPRQGRQGGVVLVPADAHRRCGLARGATTGRGVASAGATGCRRRWQSGRSGGGRKRARSAGPSARRQRPRPCRYRRRRRPAPTHRVRPPPWRPRTALSRTRGSRSGSGTRCASVRGRASSRRLCSRSQGSRGCPGVAGSEGTPGGRAASRRRGGVGSCPSRDRCRRSRWWADS